MDVLRTFDLLDRYMQKYPKEDALCFKQNSKKRRFITEKYQELLDQVYMK